MMWDQTGIFVCEWLHYFLKICFIYQYLGYYYRVSIPQDITDGDPQPATWSTPSAALSPAGCNIDEFFFNHSIVFGKSLLLYNIDFINFP